MMGFAGIYRKSSGSQVNTTTGYDPLDPVLTGVVFQKQNIAADVFRDPAGGGSVILKAE